MLRAKQTHRNRVHAQYTHKQAPTIISARTAISFQRGDKQDSSGDKAPQQSAAVANQLKHKASAFGHRKVPNVLSHAHDQPDVDGKPSQSLANRLRSNSPQSMTKKFSEINDIVFEPVMPPPEYDAEVPKLITGLRQVLQYDGPVTIGQMDEKTPYIDPKSVMRHIPQPEDINWEAIPPFITSSRDPSLLKLAQDHGARFMGSTSSVSSLLSQLHFALTQYATIKTAHLSHWFQDATATHTRASVKPAVSLIRKRGPDIWGIDNAPSGDPKQNQILIDLGKSLERHLTYEWDDFKRIFVRQFDDDNSPIPNVFTEGEIQESEAHAFLKSGNLLLRSQLDCDDETVRSDKKVFDLKTRATLPIRLDVLNHANYVDYRVTAREGLYNSFEREFYDMGRSAFLKYAFQCRIGGMGGVFVAYHNTRELFGFEYIPIEKMDQVVYGSSDRANFVFRHGLNLMDKLASRVINDNAAPGRQTDTVRITCDAQQNGKLVVYAETFPDVDLDDPIALDRAISCPHRGSVYIDWLSADQARLALRRRGLNTEGERPELISRLESATCVPSVLYAPPTEEFIHDLIEKGNFKVYNFYTDLHNTITNTQIDWAQLTDDNLDKVKVRYDIRQVQQSQNTLVLARRYHQMVLEHNLIDKGSAPLDNVQLPAETEQNIYSQFVKASEDATTTFDSEGNPMKPQFTFDDAENLSQDDKTQLREALKSAKKEYLDEVVDHVTIGDVQVPITRKDQASLQRKKHTMNVLMSHVGEYGQLNTLGGDDKTALEQKLKDLNKAKPPRTFTSHRRAI